MFILRTKSINRLYSVGKTLRYLMFKNVVNIITSVFKVFKKVDSG